MEDYFVYDRDEDCYDYSQMPRDQKAHFDEIMHNEFGGKYEIQRNVPPGALIRDNPPACPPLSYLLIENGKPKAAVVLAVPTQKIRFENTKQLCNRIGIPCIRFYTTMPNVRDYVVDRIFWFLQTSANQ